MGLEKETLQYLLKPTTSQTKQSPPERVEAVNQNKAPKMKKNAAFEVKKKEEAFYFTHPAQGSTNSHPHLNQK